MKHKIIANKEVLKENMERLRSVKDLSNINKNRESLEVIRKDQEENGKYYAKTNDDTYNPFKEFFKK